MKHLILRGLLFHKPIHDPRERLVEQNTPAQWPMRGSVATLSKIRVRETKRRYLEGKVVSV